MLPRRGEPPLEPDETCALAQQVEVGVLARAARLDPSAPWRGDATDEELAALERQGERARQRFLGANLRLVGMVTRSFGQRARADLYQEGCLGLIAAVERFDHRRGLRFSTYAMFWVRAAVGAAAARQVGAAELPTSRWEQLRAARGLEAELAQRLGRPPTVAEVADGLGRSTAWTAGLLAHRPTQSLDALDPAAVEAVVGTVPADGSATSLGWVRGLLDGLPPVERQVIELRLGFLDGRVRPAVEVARTLQQPVGRVRRTEQRALERLRAVCPQQAWAEL